MRCSPNFSGAMVKRKRVFGAKNGGHKPPQGTKAAAAADADVDSDDEQLSEQAPPSEGDDDEFFETPDEKRVRLAKEYLGKLGDTKPPEAVQEQLVHDAEEHARKARVQVEDLVLGEPRFLKGHKMPATCICLDNDEQVMYSGGKDCAVLRWDVESGTRSVLHAGGRNRFECGGHFHQVLSVCLVEQRQLLVSGGVDRLVRLWDPRLPAKSSCIEAMHGHSGPVTGIVAEPDSTQLYTASMDKSIKLWDLRTRRCTNTLFGHVSGVTGLDIYNKGRPLTAGVDKSVRLWKVDKDTHLMFSKHTYAVDAVTVMDHDRFVSGSQNGCLHLWSNASKKPIATAALPEKSGWVTALGGIRRGNVFFSASVDGMLRPWRFTRAGEASDKSLKLVPAMEPIKAPGCVNAIAVGRRLLACAVGKETKFGRWFYDKSWKNGVLLVPLSYREA